MTENEWSTEVGEYGQPPGPVTRNYLGYYIGDGGLAHLLRYHE
jgi:hypothetical protein